MSVDLVIVGGGPVGLAAALYAVRTGLVPIVLERDEGVFDKACGEGLMPGGVAALEALGVAPAGRALLGIRYVRGDRSVEARFRDGPGRGVRRPVLVSALRAAVLDAGVSILAVDAEPPEQDDRGVSVRTRTSGRDDGPVVRGRYLLAADGLHSGIRRSLGLTKPAHGPRRWGQRRHYELTPWSEHVEVHWGAIGEAYVTPVSADLVGVAMLSDHRLGFDEQLSRFPALSERLRPVPAVTPVKGAGPLRQRSSRRVEGRILLVGDASGYVDSLTGEGISLGLAQAHAAVDALRTHEPARYERDWRRVSWRYAALTHGLVQGTRPRWARRAIVPAAAALPFLFEGAVNELGRAR